MNTMIKGLGATLVMMLAACGGGSGGGDSAAPAPGPGGGGTPTPTTTTIKGTIASGIALGGANLAAKCTDGSSYTATATASGEFSFTLPASAAYPCLLKGWKDAQVMYSVAMSAGDLSVTPITGLIVAKLAGMPAGDFYAAFPSGTSATALNSGNVAAAQSTVRAVLADVADVSAIADFLTTPFKAATTTTAGDTIDKALDAVNAGLKAKGIAASTLGLVLAQGKDVTTIKSLVATGNTDTVANIPTAKTWASVRRTGGAGGSRLVGVGGMLYSFNGANQAPGLVASSDNGNTWQEIDMPLRDSPYAVTLFKGRLVVAGWRFNIITSTDNGKTWTDPKTLPGLPAALQPSLDPNYHGPGEEAPDCLVTVGEKLFAYTSLSTIEKYAGTPTWVSTDGMNFQVAAPSDTDAFWNAVQSTTGDRRCYRQVIPNSAKNLLSDTGYADTMATGSRYFKTTYVQPTGSDLFGKYSWFISTDKIQWTSIDVPTNWWPTHIAEVSSGRFIALVERTSNETIATGNPGPWGTYLSIDGGLTWRDVGGGPASASSFGGGATQDKTIVLVATDGLITRSTDGGTTWSDWTGNSTPLNAVAFGSNQFVAIGDNGTILRSTDNGLTWTKVASNSSAPLRSITFGAGKFTVFADNGEVISSSDGSTWASTGAGLKSFAPLLPSESTANGSTIMVVSPPKACVNSVCGSWNSGLFYSNDGGTTWNQAPLGNIAGVTYGNGYFLAAEFGNSSPVNVWASLNAGKTWNKTGTCADCRYLTPKYSNGLFYSKGDFGINASVDGGSTWKTYAVPGWKQGGAVLPIGNRWIAHGQNNLVRISPL